MSKCHAIQQVLHEVTLLLCSMTPKEMNIIDRYQKTVNDRESRSELARHPFMNYAQCPFCHVEAHSIELKNDYAVALFDGFPITEGHMLVIPKRHAISLYELTEEEQAAMWKLVALARAELIDEFEPDGFNIGINDGLAAGQTVMHAHIHVIPRRTGDVANPRGGIRWIIPNKAQYWAEDRQ